METITRKQKLIMIALFLILLPATLLLISLAVKKSAQTPSSTPELSKTPTNFVTPQQGTIPTPTPLPPLQLVSITPPNGTTNILSATTFILTFTRFIYPGEVAITFSPNTTFTVRLDKSTMYIDATALSNGTTYTLTASPTKEISKSFHFTTASATSSVYKDTTGQQIDDWTKNNRPDITVQNNLPHSSSSFTIQSISGSGHYTFQVALIGTTGKQDFMTWLKTTVGLNDTQIGKLDIQYQ